VKQLKNKPIKIDLKFEWSNATVCLPPN